jgi:hypothetical protein
MIYEDITEFAAALPPMQALIGLDLGEKTIGVAVSDSFLSIATPLETVRRKKFGVDAARLSEIIADRRIGGLILGLPRAANRPAPLRAISTGWVIFLSGIGMNGLAPLPPNAPCSRRIRLVNVVPRSLITWRQGISCKVYWIVCACCACKGARHDR